MNTVTDDPALQPIITAADRRAPIPGAAQIPVTLLRPNPYNPRKRLDPKRTADLAESIARFGVMHPILVRPLANAPAGEPQYEIVAGERRWRACQLLEAKAKPSRNAPVRTIDAIVREINDFEALEMATVENLEREDLNPIEEAEGFHQLMHPPLSVLHGKAYTADDIAAKFHRSRRYVFNSLKLLELIASARDALFDGKLDKSVALLIARVPEADQPKALKECLQGYGGDPFTQRQAQDHIHRCYMLRLDRAAFKITDATLLPQAGSCRDCPKRTGANPDLFADVKHGDTCTDPGCYHAKEDAHKAALRAQAEAAGATIVDKPKPGEYLRLDTPDNDVDMHKPLGKLLGKASGVDTVMIETTDGLVAAVKKADAHAVLKSKGLLKRHASASANNHQAVAEAKAKAGTAWRRAVAIACLESIDKHAGDGCGSKATQRVDERILQLGAEALYCQLPDDSTKLMHSLLGSAPMSTSRWSNDGITKVRAAIARLDTTALMRFVAVMSVAGDLRQPTHSTDTKATDSRLLELAKACKVDAEHLRHTIMAERAAAARAKAKPKAVPAKKKPSVSLGALMRAGEPAAPAAKPPRQKRPGGNRKAPAAKGKPLVKYRDKATGSTWSGRGLQPKWLKVALASGRQLAEFSASVATTITHLSEAAAQPR